MQSGAKYTGLATKLLGKYFSDLRGFQTERKIETDVLLVEPVMNITAFKHFFCRLVRFPRPAKQLEATQAGAPYFNADPFWHGDHWQNLLSSPMDARHYVMEDWAAPASEEFDARRASWKKEQRRSHRRAQ